MIAAIGLPTMLLRPITTQFLPGVLTPDSLSSTWIPAGVQGMNPSRSPTRIDPTDHRVRIDVFGQRHLNQYAVDFGIRIQGVDFGEKIRLGDVDGQPETEA